LTQVAKRQAIASSRRESIASTPTPPFVSWPAAARLSSRLARTSTPFCWHRSIPAL